MSSRVPSIWVSTGVSMPRPDVGAPAQAAAGVPGLPPWWKSKYDISLISDAAAQGFHPGARRTRCSGISFVERFLIKRCSHRIRVRALRCAPLADACLL